MVPMEQFQAFLGLLQGKPDPANPDAKIETYEFRGMIAVKFPSGRANLHILLPDLNGWANRIGAFQGRFDSLESAQTFAAEN